jgi:toluene monooxygenase electron transfer component
MTPRITIDGGEAFGFAADEDTILRAALRAGLGFPHECSVGGCGACRFDLVEGEVETLWEEAPGLSERDRRRGKRLACQTRALGDCTVKVRLSDDYRPAVPTARLPGVLKSRCWVTPDMAEITLETAAEARFLPGQYALLHAPGITGARAYSMSNLANADGIWRFIIRRVPGGQGSNILTEAVPVGGEVMLDGPYGHAYLRSDVEREIVCIAGGSGVGPMLSIARGALEQGLGPTVHFFEGARTHPDLCGGKVLAALSQQATLRLRYTPVLSAATQDHWSGARGFVHELVQPSLDQPLDQYEYYFAGPPPMIDAVQTLLAVQNQVPHSQIHFDRFV